MAVFVLLFVDKEHRYLADAACPDDQGLLDVACAARPSDDSQLGGLFMGIFAFHGLESSTHPWHKLLGSGIHQKDVGQGVGLASFCHGVGEDDAARLRHQTFATRQADQFLLRFTFLALSERDAVFGQQLLHVGTGTPQRFPAVLGRQLADALGKLGLALQIDENAAVFLEILHESDGRAVFLFDGHPGLSALVDVLEQGFLPLNEGVAHLGEHLLLEGGVGVVSFVVPSHGCYAF